MKQFRERSFSSTRSSTVRDKWDHQEADRTVVDIILKLRPCVENHHLLTNSDEWKQFHLLRSYYYFFGSILSVTPHLSPSICFFFLKVVTLLRKQVEASALDCVPVFDFWGSDDRIFLLRHSKHIWTRPSYETSVFSHHTVAPTYWSPSSQEACECRSHVKVDRKPHGAPTKLKYWSGDEIPVF